MFNGNDNDEIPSQNRLDGVSGDPAPPQVPKKRRKAYLGPNADESCLPRTTAWRLRKSSGGGAVTSQSSNVDDTLSDNPSIGNEPVASSSLEVNQLPFCSPTDLHLSSNVHFQGTADLIVAPVGILLDAVCTAASGVGSPVNRSPSNEDPEDAPQHEDLHGENPDAAEHIECQHEDLHGENPDAAEHIECQHEDLHEENPDAAEHIECQHEDLHGENPDAAEHIECQHEDLHEENPDAAEHIECQRDQRPINPVDENNGIHNYDEQPSHQRLRGRMHGDFEPPINTPINVSRNDALYMALGLARRHNFSNVSLCNAVKLINALFVSPVLPATIDLLDSLLVCTRGTKYYFYCQSCREFFGELDFKNIKFHVCPTCRMRNPISDLRVAHFFVIFDVPHQLQNLLQNNFILNALLTPAEAAARRRPGFISDIWDGSVYQTFSANVANLRDRIFSFHFSVDGSPLATSSMCSIWPIQLALNELPPELRTQNLLLGGLWFGVQHARMDLFLEPFASHFRELSLGFNIKVGPHVEQARAFCIGCCVDSGARGQVQGLKTHTGYNSCNWCNITGEWIGGHVRFPLRQERPLDRNHDELLRLQHIVMDHPLPEEEELLENDDERNDPGIPEAERNLFGVNSVSPLINLPYFENRHQRVPTFNMIDGFFVDSMHMIDLGISKFFLTRWMEDFGHEYYIKHSETEINRRIKTLRPPLEFRRMPRGMAERSRFKARELQNWMMFSCVPVLTGILRDKFLKVWLLLIQALYLINQNEVSLEHLDIADILITYFLVFTQEHYGDVDMTFNLHILKHLVAHVRRNGPPWASCAYCFEDGNGKLKSTIHSNQGIPHQVIRALSWKESANILEGSISQKARDYVLEISQPEQHKQRSVVVGSDRLIGKPQPIQLSPEELFHCEQNGHAQENLECYKKVIHKNCAFTDNSDQFSKTDNSVAQLIDQSIVLIQRILFDREQNEIFLLVSDVDFQTLLVPPEGVHLERNFHFMRKIVNISEELRYISCSDLKVICFRSTFPHGDFLAPFPNVFNRQ